ncbi:MAG: hypothetical protein ACI9T8_000553, partial [Candidatus Saccharimonadales bacterium]
MSMFASTGAYSRGDDWWIAGATLVVALLVLYPLRVLFLRYQHVRRINKNLVTSAYKLPIKLTPAELAYVFSTRVSRAQMYATLRDLANRSVLTMHKRSGTTFVELGPKLDSTLQPFEQLLVSYVHKSKRAVSIEDILVGDTVYTLASREVVRGSRDYVFWWLLKKNLRKRGLIEHKMTGRYTSILFKFGFFGSLFVATGPLFSYRLLQMMINGEVGVSNLIETFANGLLFWLIALVPVMVVSFFMLRFSGRMTGRKWLMTDKFYRYLGQLEGYREFVRLTHKNKLKFESKGLNEEAVAET